MVKAGTSVGANYCEADDAECKKEARESKHFLRMLAAATQKITNEIKPAWQEAKELNLIYNYIYKNSK